MDYRHEGQQKRQELLNIVDRGTVDRLFNFLQKCHRKPFRTLHDVLAFDSVIDDQIDFIDCTATRYHVTPLIIAAGKGSFEKTKILLVHGADPNKQCATGDTALNLAVHRQKYHIVDLLLKYRANPNIYNRSGKTALHRAAASYIDENANQVRALLNAGADPRIGDRNMRMPLDEAVITNKPEIVSTFLMYDRTLVQRAHRAAVIGARLGHDRCLEALLDYGMDPNIGDRTRTTPLHAAVRSMKLSTVQLLVARGADPNFLNAYGETPLSLTEYLQPDMRQLFVNALVPKPKEKIDKPHSTVSTVNLNETTDTMSMMNEDTPIIDPMDTTKYSFGHETGTFTSSIHPLLRNHRNWTLDSDEYRSPTDANSSVQNLLDLTSSSYWCCTQNKNAWVIFDLKHQYNISGMRLIGCENQSKPKSGFIEVSNAFNGPWLKVQDFHCQYSQSNNNDFFFSPLKTRFIRVFILDNYGGTDIRIQGIGFFGVDMHLVNLLRDHELEKSLRTLLANNINDVETLKEKRDEILNSSDKYLDVNNHFQFLRLIEALRIPKLTRLEWFNPPYLNAIAGEKLQTFSAAGDEGVASRVKLEEQSEKTSQIRTVLLRDLEPIQGRSLVDFPDYVIKEPGRYKVRVVSLDEPSIQTAWQDIIVSAKTSTTTPNVIDVSSNGTIHKPPGQNILTPTTDVDQEVDHISSHKHPPHIQTPGLPPSSSVDSTSDVDHKHTISPTKPTILKKKLVDGSTQSDQKSTRNVGTMHEPIKTRNFGTMHEPIKTRNFGNTVQPQSCSTQTSIGPKPDKSRPKVNVWELPDTANQANNEQVQGQRGTPQPAYTPCVICQSDTTLIYPQYPPPVSSTPSPKEVYIYNGRYQPSLHKQHDVYVQDSFEQHCPHCSPIPYVLVPQGHGDVTVRTTRRLHTSSSPQRPVRKPSPPYRSRTPTYLHRPRSTTPRQRPTMHSQETDTSLDGMKTKHHAGVQYEPLPTRDTGTMPSLRAKSVLCVHHGRTIDPTFYAEAHSTLSKAYDRSRANHFIPPTEVYDSRYNYQQQDYDDEFDDDEYDAPSMHDQSTMAELIVYLDHYTQCESQPFLADRYVQTTSMSDEAEYRNNHDSVNGSFVHQLPHSGSISISQPTIIQPDSIPRRRPPASTTHPSCNGVADTGNVYETPVYHGHVERLDSIRDSPPLKIGTQHIVNQSFDGEYVTPFETHFVYESDSISTRGSRSRNSCNVPVYNSSRTQLFSKSPAYQSRSNGNFFLSSGPTRSSQASLHVDVTTD